MSHFKKSKKTIHLLGVAIYYGSMHMQSAYGTLEKCYHAVPEQGAGTISKN